MIGLAVTGLDPSGLLGEGESSGLVVRELWLPVQTRITEELAHLLSDRSVGEGQTGSRSPKKRVT